MLNPDLAQRLTAIQQSLIAHRAGSVGLPSAMAGSERETFLREYLQTLFPAQRRFTSGVITDADGHLSGQVDIAVEYGFTPSFPMPGGSERLLLAEGVAAVIEVKSDLAAQWDQVISTTQKVKRLQRQLNAVIIAPALPPGDEIPVIAVGYRGHSTVESLAKRLESTALAARPDAALVIETGCFVGLGMTGTGAAALYALAVALDALFQQLLTTRPDLTRYIR